MSFVKRDEIVKFQWVGLMLSIQYVRRLSTEAKTWRLDEIAAVYCSPVCAILVDMRSYEYRCRICNINVERVLRLIGIIHIVSVPMCYKCSIFEHIDKTFKFQSLAINDLKHEGPILAYDRIYDAREFMSRMGSCDYIGSCGACGMHMLGATCEFCDEILNTLVGKFIVVNCVLQEIGFIPEDVVRLIWAYIFCSLLPYLKDIE